MSSNSEQMKCIIICGPTASGKSALAVDLANKLQGEVINADSMQIYSQLEILTARPSLPDLELVPHRLFGVRSLTEPCSVSIWRKMAIDSIKQVVARGRLPIVCGGTGMYIRYLTKELAAIPTIPLAFRVKATERLLSIGNKQFSEELVQRDPTMRGKTPVGDSQRLIRAWEVLEATGKSLTEWQALNDKATDINFYTILLMPDRESLYHSCDERFLGFIGRGALDEVVRIKDMKLDPTLPGMKALGLPQLINYLEGDIDLNQAIEEAQRHTRRYAKRQMTWFRNQLKPNYLQADLNTKKHYGKIQDLVIKFLKN
jgi:tRNA dimethylallyltransferase